MLSKIGQGLAVDERLAICGDVGIAFNSVMSFEVGNSLAQEISLLLLRSSALKVVDPHWLALGHGNSLLNIVLEIFVLCAFPEPMDGKEANVAASGLTIVEEFLEPWMAGLEGAGS